MAKIVLPEASIISFDNVLPIEIIDHIIRPGLNTTVFKYRVRFQINSLDILKVPLYLTLSGDSPVNVRPNMFKNVNITSTASALNAIKTFDNKRLASLSQNRTTIATTPVEYADIQRGYVDFDVKLPSLGIKTIFAYFTSNKPQSVDVLTTYRFENSDVIERYEMPYDDFFFNSQQVNKNMRRILIASNDKKITQFRVTTRTLYGASESQLDTQSKTLVAKVRNGQAFVDIPETDQVCREYRVSPVSFLTKTPLSQCKTVRVNEIQEYTGKCVIYPIEISSQKAVIAATSIPADVVGIKLLRRCITQGDQTFDTILSTNQLSALSTGLEDTSVIPYRAYEYKLRFEFSNGLQKASESNCVVFPMFLNNVVSLNVENISNTYTRNLETSQFKIDVTYKSTTAPARVINDLKALGIGDIFPNEIKNLSTQIDPLIAVLVTRVSLQAGTEESVGLYKPGVITVTSQDLTDCVYRFEVCVRSPADVIEEIGGSSDFTTTNVRNQENNNTIIDKVLSLNNVVNPRNFTQKFFSKNSLTKGQLAYGSALQTSSAGIESGKTGIQKYVIVKNQKIAPTISSPSASRKAEGLLLKWTAVNLDDVTKFEIVSSEGVTQICDLDKNVKYYAATIRTQSAQATLKTFTNYGVIITTDFSA